MVYTAKVTFNTLKLEGVQFSTYDELLIHLQTKWKVLQLSAFKLVCVATAGFTAQEIFDDDSMRGALESNTTGTVKNLKVVVLTHGFSHFCKNKADDVLPGHAEKRSDEDFQPDQTVDSAVYDAEAKAVQLEIKRRAIVINNASVYSMKEFISPVLIGAVTIAITKLPALRMMCEKRVVGINAQGSVDYILFLGLLFILVGEAKLNDIRGGARQNYVQQRACQDSQANKMIPSRMLGLKRKAAFSDAIKVVQTMDTAGIVSTARLYQFSKCHFNDATNECSIRHSKEYELILSTSNDVERAAQLKQLKTILRIIVDMIFKQNEMINNGADARHDMTTAAAVDLTSDVPDVMQNDRDEMVASQLLDELEAVQGSNSVDEDDNVE